MDSDIGIAVDGAESAFVNGGVTDEVLLTAGENGVASNSTNGTTGEVLDTASETRNENPGNHCDLGASEHPKEATMDTQDQNVNDQKRSREQKAQGNVKGEKPSGGKNVTSVSIKKKIRDEKIQDAKVAASNGSAAPNTKKSLKSKSFSDRQAHVTKGKHDSAPAESIGEKTRVKPLKKQSNDTSEGDSESSKSPRAEDGKSRRVGALPNYGFSFRCDQRAEKRREFYSKLEEKIHAKELEKSSIQAKSKETQDAEIKMLRKSLNFKATPMPSFYQEPQPPKVELKKIPPTRPKSPKLGRKKTASAEDSEETTETPRIGRLSLDEKGSKNNLIVKETLPVDPKKPPVRKSLPRLPSQKTNLPDGKNEGKAAPPAKAAATNTTKAKHGKKKPDKDASDAADSSNLSSPNDDTALTTESSNAAHPDNDESPVALQSVAVEL